MASRILPDERRAIRDLVEHYKRNQHLFETILSNLATSIRGSDTLRPHIHSTKGRLKEPTHLKDKLERQLYSAKASGKKFGINRDNLFRKINDLAGFRILHLYTHEIASINKGLNDLFVEENYRIREGPTARTWDDESRGYFGGLGIKTVKSPSLYTSVHYVVEPNRKTPCTCEIQVRTLVEEVWGEVNHSINYPHASKSLSCREQIKVLARLTSSCTRLVDSIYAVHQDSIRKR